MSPNDAPDAFARGNSSAPPPDPSARDVAPNGTPGEPDAQAVRRTTGEPLSSQVGVHKFEIAFRKNLLGFDAEDEQALVKVQPAVLEELDSIVTRFYETITAAEDVALIIGDRDTTERLFAAQRSYIQDLFSGSYDQDYVDVRLRIGLVHKRIGLEPKYYLAAVHVLWSILEETLERKVADPEARAKAVRALDRLMYFDATLVFDTYIHSMLVEIEVARDKSARYALLLEKEVAERTDELVRLSRSDSLTGLLEKRAFFGEVRKELARARRLKHPLSLVYFDVDKFKSVNDTKGHHHGDKVLHAIGREISRRKREVDLAGRFGGDEFFLALPGTTKSGAETFMQSLEERIIARAGVAISYGVVETDPNEPRSVEDLLAIADRRMYAMKHERRAREQPGKSPGTRPAADGRLDAENQC